MLEVVTPEREIYRAQVSEVQLPGRTGYLGILPGHTPLLTELGIGTLSYKERGNAGYVAVMEGFAEVLPDRVTVLAEAAERPADIDVDRARKALAEAENKLNKSASDPNADWDAVLHAISRAKARIEVAAHTHAAGSARAS